MTHDRAPRYQHIQPGVFAYVPAYREALDYLNAVIRRLAFSPDLFTTKKTARELQKTADYLAELKLEDELFSNASPEWISRFSEREIVTQKQALLATKQKIIDTGGQFLAKYCGNMDHGHLACGTEGCATKELITPGGTERGIGWTDVSVRAAHAWADKELVALNEELKPLATAARKRTQMYQDEMNITNRYIGYRSNMGYLKYQSPQDTKVLENVLEWSLRPSVAPRWNLGHNWIKAETVGTRNYQLPGEEECGVDILKFIERYKTKNDPQKAAGISLQFPGKSEYEDTYHIPSLVEIGLAHKIPPVTHRSVFEHPPGVRGRGSLIALDPSQVKSKGYKLNPKPNYLSVFSSAREARDDEPQFPSSEYTSRYIWPAARTTKELSWMLG